MLRLCLLLCCLSIVHLTPFSELSYLEGVPDMKSNSECNGFYFDIVDYYFAKTMMIPSDLYNVQYCNLGEARRRESRHISNSWLHLNTDIIQIILFYASLSNVIHRTNNNRNSPILDYGTIQIDDNTEIPLYATANIFYRHTLGSRARDYPDSVGTQMDLMGRLGTDERGHLLALSLGGGNGPDNIVPMARTLNRHLRYSYWRSIEQWILNFLRAYRNGRVYWRMALQYPRDIFLNSANNRQFRPIGFTVQFTAYTDQDDETSASFQSPQLSFLNDNEFSCEYEQTGSSHLGRRFGWPFTSSQESQCKSVSYPPRPQAKVGPTTVIDKWNQKYAVSFPFAINGRQYFYGQSILEGKNYFIQELLPNGIMGEETDHGFLNYNNLISFPYTINGRHFFYGQSIDYYNRWSIIELLPGGKLGGETSYGYWNQRYEVCFPYTIDGRYYFYCQSNYDGKNWFIQELLPDGLMGPETDHGFWSDSYSVSFPFTINGRQFFHSQGKHTYNWFIQELLPGGKMGYETDHGSWNQRYEVSFPFNIGHKQFFFAHSIIDGDNYFIQELLPGGKMGRETEHGFMDQKYPIMFEYMIYGRHFYYAHSHNTKKWFLMELV